MYQLWDVHPFTEIPYSASFIFPSPIPRVSMHQYLLSFLINFFLLLCTDRLNTTWPSFVDWSFLDRQQSPNLQSIPKIGGHAPSSSKPLRILVSRSHRTEDFSEHLKKAFGSTPVEIIPAGGSGNPPFWILRHQAIISH